MTKASILIVDDDEGVRTVLESELLSEGYVVETASDGDDAIAMLRGGKEFDLILLDIKMPRVDGFEVLEFVKKESPAAKVIMLTAYADLSNAIKSKRLGAEELISKPYDLIDLLTTVERILCE